MPKGAIKNGQSRGTENIGYTRQRKTKQNYNAICVVCGHHYTKWNINNVNETSALLQTTGGKDEPNIVFLNSLKRTVHTMKKNKTKIQRNMCGHHYTQTNTNNVNKSSALRQTTGSKDELNIIFLISPKRTKLFAFTAGNCLWINV